MVSGPPIALKLGYSVLLASAIVLFFALLVAAFVVEIWFRCVVSWESHSRIGGNTI